MKGTIRKNIFIKYTSVLLLVTLITTSCHSYHPLHEKNYFNGNTLYNEPLKINVQYFGDISMIPLKDLKRKDVKNKTRSIKEVAPVDLLAFGRANVNPEYEVLLFMKEFNGQEKDTLERTSLVYQDSVRNKVLYKKSKGNKAAYFLLEASNDNSSLQSITNDGLHLANSLSFDINVQEKLTYSEIFERYKEEDNYLFVREKLKNAPIAKNEQNE